MECWSQRNLSRAGQPLRYLPVVERMRQAAARGRSPFVRGRGLQAATQGTDAQGVPTLEALATLPLPIPFNPVARRDRGLRPDSRAGADSAGGPDRRAAEIRIASRPNRARGSPGCPRLRPAISSSILKAIRLLEKAGLNTSSGVITANEDGKLCRMKAAGRWTGHRRGQRSSGSSISRSSG